MEIFRAFGTLAIQGADAVQKAIRGMEQAGEKLAKKLDEIGAKAESVGGALSRRLTAPLVAAAGAAAALSLRTINYARDLREAGRQIGISTRDLERLRLGFAGVLSAQETDAALSTMSRGIQDFVANGGGALQQFFEDNARRGSDFARRMASMSPTDQLEELFQTVRRGSLSLDQFRARLYQIGPEFAQMAEQYWREGEGMFRRVEERGREHPAAMSENLHRLTELWDSTWRRIADQAAGWSNRIAEAVIPVMIRLAEAFETRVVPWVERLVGWIEQAAAWFTSLDAATQEWTVAIGALAAALGPILVVVGGLLKALALVVRVFNPVVLAFGLGYAAGLLLVEGLRLLGAGIQWLEAKLYDLIGAAGEWASQANAAFTEWLEGVYASIRDWFGQAMAWLADWGNSFVAWLVDLGTSALDAMGEWLSRLPQMFGATASEAYEAIVGWFRRLPEAVGRFISDMADRALSRIRSMVSGITGALSSLYDTVVGNSIIPDLARDVVREVAGMADGSITQTERMARGIASPLSKAAAGISSTFGQVGAEMARMVTEGVTQTPALAPAGTAAQVSAPPRTGLAVDIGAAARITIDARNSIFRDDRDMLDRMRLQGADPLGVY